MFLRKIVQHLRTQNWTAIGIDLLIVVVGVFLGAQASNWNEERKVRAGETEFLERLHEDLTADLAVMRVKSAFLAQTNEAGRRAESFIAAGRPCAGNCWTVLVDFFAASQFEDLSPSGDVLQHLRQSPYPYDRRLKRDLETVYSIMEQYGTISGPTEYRRRMRLKVPMKALLALWDCHSPVGVSQTIDYACRPGASDAEAGAVVERLRADPDLRAELAVDVGMRAALVEDIADNDRMGRAVLKKIEARIGRR